MKSPMNTPRNRTRITRNSKASVVAWVVLATFGGTFVGQLSAQAAPKSSFTPEQLEKSVAGFCRDMTSLSERFSEEDLTTMSKEIADQIAYSEPERFNDIVGHVLAEYYHYPQHRTCLAMIVKSMFTPNETEIKAGEEAALVRELKEYKKSAVTKVVDKVFFAFTVAYTFEFGKGIWKTRGSGLKGLELFGSKVRLIGESYKAVGKYPWTMKAGVAGIGAGVGFAEVVYDALATKKSDPRTLIAELQHTIIGSKAKKMSEILKELRALDALDAKALLGSAAIHRSVVYWADLEVTMADQELKVIYDQAAQFRGELTPLSEDMSAAQELMDKLMRKLGPGDGSKPGPSLQDLADDNLIP